MDNDVVFSKTILPVFLGLLSGKIREQQAAVQVIRQHMPLLLPRLGPKNAERLIGALLDWLRFELRSVSASRTTDTTKLAYAIKEFKWNMAQLDLHHPRLVIREKFDALLDVLSTILELPLTQFDSEICNILNTFICSRHIYMDNLLLNQNRLKRLCLALSKCLANAVESPDVIKSLLSLSLCPSEMTEPILVGAFSVHLSSISSEHALLLNEITCISSFILESIDLSKSEVHGWLKCLINVFDTSGSSGLFFKIVQFIQCGLFRGLYDSDATQQIRDWISASLASPDIGRVICALQPLDFALSIQDFLAGRYKSCPVVHLQLLSLFKVCSLVGLKPIRNDGTPILPYCLYLAITVQSSIIDLSGRPSNQEKHPTIWIELIMFHNDPSASLFNHGAANINWYMIWFCSTAGVDYNIAAADKFAQAFFGFQMAAALEPFILQAIAVYFNDRFCSLWWTKTAISSYSVLLDWLFSTLAEQCSAQLLLKHKLIFNYASCALVPFGLFETDDASGIDSKELELCLFLQRCSDSTPKPVVSPSSKTFPGEQIQPQLAVFVERLNQFSTELKSNAEQSHTPKSTVNVINSSLDLLIYVLRSFYEQNNTLKFQPTIRLSDLAHAERLRFLTSFSMLSRGFSFAIIRAADFHSLLSWLIPETMTIMDTHNQSFENINPDDVDASFAERLQLYSVTIAAPSLYRCRQFAWSLNFKIIRALISIHCNILCALMTNTDIWHGELFAIVNDWKLFLDEQAKGPVMPALLSENEGLPHVESENILLTFNLVNKFFLQEITLSDQLQAAIHNPFLDIGWITDVSLRRLLHYDVSINWLEKKLKCVPDNFLIDLQVIQPCSLNQWLCLLHLGSLMSANSVCQLVVACPAVFLQSNRLIHMLLKISQQEKLFSAELLSMWLGGGKLLPDFPLLGALGAAKLMAQERTLATLLFYYGSVESILQFGLVDKVEMIRLLCQRFDQVYASILQSYSNGHSHRSSLEPSIQNFMTIELFTSCLKARILDVLAELLSLLDGTNSTVLFKCIRLAGKPFKILPQEDLSELFNPIHGIICVAEMLAKGGKLVGILSFLNSTEGLKSSLSFFSAISACLSRRFGFGNLSTLENLLALSNSVEFNDQVRPIHTVASSKTKADTVSSFGEAISLYSLDLPCVLLKYCHACIFERGQNVAFSCKIAYLLLNLKESSEKKCLNLKTHPGLLDTERDCLQVFITNGSTPVFVSIDSINPTIPKIAVRNLEDEKLWEEGELAEIGLAVIGMLNTNSASGPTGFCLKLAEKLLNQEHHGDAHFLRCLVTCILHLFYTEKLVALELKHKVLRLALDNGKFCIVPFLPGTIDLGPNLISRLFHERCDNLAQLQQISELALRAGDWKVMFYHYLLALETPRNRQKPDLSLLTECFKLGSDQCKDYYNVSMKRLNHFDFAVSDKLELPIESAWIETVWLKESDLKLNSDRVRFHTFIKQRDQLNWLMDATMAKVTDAMADDCNSLNSKLMRIIGCKRSITEDALADLIAISAQSPSVLECIPYLSPKLGSFAAFQSLQSLAEAKWRLGFKDMALDIGRAAWSQFEGSKLAAMTTGAAGVLQESKALWLMRLSEWSGELKADRPSFILRTYLDPVKAMCTGTSSAISNTSTLARIHITIARFADEQYTQLIQSDDMKMRAKMLQETRSALEATRHNLSRSSAATPEEKRQLERSLHEITAQYNLDQNEYTERLKGRNGFLLSAVKSYLAAMALGIASVKEETSAVFRLCSLWFEHSDQPPINDEINNHLARGDPLNAGQHVPIKLFLPLIYQLAARASCPDPKALTPFQKVLLRLLVQMTMAHPHTCLYQLLCLRSTGPDDPIAKRRRLVSPASIHDDPAAENRAAAASFIIDHVRKQPGMGAVIEAVELLCSAYIELANLGLKDKEQAVPGSVKLFPDELRIKRLIYPLDPSMAQLFTGVPVPTATDVTFSGFSNGFTFVGGMNLPKKIAAIGSDGSRHCQLVKGNDDVRQDAVMEQVFCRVNELLARDVDTRNRQLSMRTYRVIPLQPLIGLLEWIPQSIPLTQWLADAHQRLRPHDLKLAECRELLQNICGRPGASVPAKLDVLQNQIWPKFAPVLRHFFFETFSKTAESFWQAKATYTQSLATSSIVGWIVGLGDRHGMNILLDQNTGGVIHIDLNMIFEVGKTLRIPELVPFRLTPDCVDPLGPDRLGLDGPFREHCIATLRLLKRERALLLMIMEVFKYDPLQKWTGLAHAAHNTSAATGSESSSHAASTSFVAKEAQRALLRIKEKLEGREEGAILSDSGQVSYLMQTAMDPELLCQMFYGWQPWL